MIKPRTLSGFMELLPENQIKFDEMKNKIEKIFVESSLTHIDTPTLELSEVLLAKCAGETEKQVYRFTKGDSDLCMRYDHTVPLAKYVSINYHDLVFPFKRYAIGKVYRGERAQKGRFREFYQCDVDIIGDGVLPNEYDGEVLSIFYKLYLGLGFENFEIRVSSRKIINQFLTICGEKDKINDTLSVIDKYYKVERSDFIKMLQDITSQDNAQKICDFVEMEAKNPFDLCDRLISLGLGDCFDESVEEFRGIIKTAITYGAKLENFKFDLRIVRGLDYYTGLVFECYLPDHLNFGSVGGGGRYETLAEYFSDKKLPGVGFGFGLTRLFSVLKDNDLLSKKTKSNSKLAIIPFEETKFFAIDLCKNLRENGILSEVIFAGKNLKQKFTIASKLNVPFVMCIGEDEAQTGLLTLKNMDTGEQTKLTLNQIIEKFK